MNENCLPFENSLIVKARAKINLHLEILGLRNDGFHELAMVMQSINLFDYLSFSSINNNEILLTSDSIDLSIGDDNLIIKAAQLIREESGCKDLGVRINLNKNIPIGAGLAGGSADAAATLIGLNRLWKLKYSNTKLEELSSKLGSDVPFCISGGTQLCFGKGHILEPINNYASMSLILVKDPNVSVSTPWAYSLNKKINNKKYLLNENDFEFRRKELRKAIWLNPLNSNNPLPLRNDLQSVVANNVQSVAEALDLLSSIPETLSVAMSGSGPSCFALFSDFDSANSVLDKYKKQINSIGLDAWCCSFDHEATRI